MLLARTPTAIPNCARDTEDIPDVTVRSRTSGDSSRARHRPGASAVPEALPIYAVFDGPMRQTPSEAAGASSLQMTLLNRRRTASR